MAGFGRVCGVSIATLVVGATVGGATVGGANAQYIIDLDEITVLATKTDEKAIESLAGVSTVTTEEAEEIIPRNFSDVIAGVPGVWTPINADDPGTSINIRGLQDFGRVAVTVDGARQNFQVSGHGADGKFYFDPEMLSQVEVSRGPVSNVYGSGAIGGVVSITTKEADDILIGAQQYGGLLRGGLGTNSENLFGSAFFAARPNENIEFIAGVVGRQDDDYDDGLGDPVADTGYWMTSELAKLTLRPGEGHEIKFSVINLDTSFNSPVVDDDVVLADDVWDNDVQTTTATAKYGYESPDNDWIDFESSLYWSHTRQDQAVLEQYAVGNCNIFCLDFTGPVGTESSFDLTTIGFDINNSSRFDGYGLHHTLTVGGDFFDDDVDSSGDDYGNDDEGYRATPSGNRRVGGAFAQWMAEHGDWLDVIAALRYDAYSMSGGGNSSEGDRLSPKFTVGVTPFDGFTIYGLYAEGYRAPAVTEAFISGFHPGAIFEYLPNPGLLPEVGKTWEVGINYQRDGLLTEEDFVRVKANAFLNNVDDFIDFQNQSSSPDCAYFVCYGYVNVAKARIKGFEFEGAYDAGYWFAGASGTILDGKDVDTGNGLDSVLPGEMLLTVGARLFDRKLTIAPTWRYVSGRDSDDPSETDYEAFHLLGLSMTYQPNERTTASIVLDNILNEYYTPFLQNLPGPGFTVKAALQVKL